MDVKYFPERKIFSSVWLHSKKYFGKYFLVFGCILENTLENPFLSCFSHFFTFSQLPNKYIIKSNKTQILNTQQKKKIIKSEINPKLENNKTRTTHATTTTTRKSKIKESKRIDDKIDPKKDRPRASRSAIRRVDLGFDERCDDFWVHDDRWRMGLTISGFATIGDKWV